MSASSQHNLAHILANPTTTLTPKPAETSLVLKRFYPRVRHTKGGGNQYIQIPRKLILEDEAVQAYLNYLKGVRDNNGQVSQNTIFKLCGAVRAFLAFTGIKLSNHGISDLVKYKSENPNSTEIEKAIQAFTASENPKFYRAQCARASLIIAVFNRGNFTPLKIRVQTHFPPAEEDCPWKTFLQIYKTLTQEQQTMIQWGLYVPQRAKAAYRMDLSKIDLEHDDYAIVTIDPTVGINKARVKHPCFVPIQFAKAVVQATKQAGRTCPFPNHQSEWSKIRNIALKDFGVHLQAKNLRKFYERAACESRLRPDYAAFFMGDKTKLNIMGGHLPLIYNPDLRERFWAEMASEITTSGIMDLLTLPT